MMMHLALAAAASVAFFTGNDLYEGFCGPHGDEATCDMYVAGVFDGARAEEELSGRPPLACLPSTITVDQLGTIFRKRLADDPEHRTSLGATLVMEGLAKAYPCRT